MSNYIGDYTEDYVDLNVKFTTRDTSGVCARIKGLKTPKADFLSIVDSTGITS